jgi:hypothetical protein
MVPAVTALVVLDTQAEPAARNSASGKCLMCAALCARVEANSETSGAGEQHCGKLQGCQTEFGTCDQ